MRRLTLADVAELNAWLKRDTGQDVDFTDFLAEPVNICLAEGNGGALFKWLWPGMYEVHVAFEQRGKEVIALSHRMLDRMRTEHGARIFVAKIPTSSHHVIVFTRIMGWKSQGTVELSHGRCELFIGE